MHIDTPIRLKSSLMSAGWFGVLGHFVQSLLGLAWWFTPAAIVVGAMVGEAVYRLSHQSATGLFRILFAARGIDAGPGFSAEDALIMQGRHAQAADSFRAWLAQHPADHEARLRLASLAIDHLARPEEAEPLLITVRDSPMASPRQEAAARQALIDLFARTGATGRQMAELARFADRYRGTPAGDAARETLHRMKDANIA